MLSIIAHHYVVNSTITQMYDYSNITGNMIFLQLWGIWGKTAINVFVLISGYFMCKSNLTIKRLLKLYLDIKFYKFLLFISLAVSGYQAISFKEIFKSVFNMAHGINNGFPASFLAFYLFIPF